MGFLSGLLGAAAPIAGGIFGGPAGGMIGGLLGGALGGGSSQSGTMTTTSQNQLDPRAAGILYGTDGKGGILGQYQGMLGHQQDPRLQTFGNTNLNYLAGAGADSMNAIHNSALGVMNGTRGRTDLPAYSVGSMVDAPKQDGMDLSGSYNSLISGRPGANPYLTAGIQGGINQSQNQFAQMQREATDNLQRNVLGGIRSNSVLAGQYGGSRQGVAEGNAISDFTHQQQDAINQFGQNNTNAATNAQLNAYNSDRDRQLAATQGLGAQQYGVASQNANTKNQAEFMNVNNLYDAHKTNAGLDMQGAQLGAGLLSGQMGNAYNVGTNQDQYGINQAQKVNGLLAPYLGMGQTQTNSQPLYQNQAGNMLGGAMFGSQLFGGSGGKGLLGDIGSLFGPGTIGAGI